ncbi:MAG: glycosyltransferase family 2 protein [Planctomycetes bacterium]|nr:glycosyltransferase family 2 protein [Planctomycetota bacterium]
MPAKISVIMPTYNRAAILRETLLDVAEQTWRPLEVVVVNDGSTDNTEEVLAEMKPILEHRQVGARFVRQDNAGASAARNRAMREATGEYFAFLDDDDRWEHGKLEKQIQTMRQAGADSSACLINNRGGTSTVPRRAEQLPQGECAAALMDREMAFHIISLVVEAGVARANGEFDTSLRNGEDIEWMMRLAHRARFASIPEVLATYNDTPGSLSDGRSLERLVQQDEGPRRALQLMHERCADRPGWDEQAWRKRVAQDYDQFVKHLLYVGDLKGARATFEEGMRLSQGADPLPRVKSKLRKARWLALIGKRLQHPKLRA